MKKKTTKIILLITTLLVLTLVFFLIRNQMVDVIKFVRNNDKESLDKFIKNRGFLGMSLISIIEALQMVVIFIPAEFIQMAAGLSYPWYLAILLCSIGIAIGASIIYFLVNILKIDQTIFSSRTEKIDQIAKNKKRSNSIMALMYLLFITPIIPFGAICYFASSNKISFKKYLFTCVTGTIPSILLSITTGNLFVFATSKGFPIWAFILIFIVAAIVLFILISIIFKKLYFQSEEYVANSTFYKFLYNLSKLLTFKYFKIKVNNESINDLKGPAIIVSNHPSFWDFYNVAKAIYPHRISPVSNKYYKRLKGLNYIMTNFKVIDKKLFVTDMNAIKKMMIYLKHDRFVVIFPEGRLSVDGTNYHIVEGVGALVKSTKVQLVIVNIKGASLVCPKWAKKKNKGHVQIDIAKKLSVEELEKLTVNEIDQIVNEGISYNDFDFAKINNYKYKGKNKALGLDGILYHCFHCNENHKMVSKGNDLICTNCNNTLTLNEEFSFNENKLNIANIHEYYLKMMEYENSNLEKDDFELAIDVKLKKMIFDKKKTNYFSTGKFYIYKDKIKYIDDNKEEYSFEKSITSLKAMPFSVNEEFECYTNEELNYFYPLKDKSICCQVALLVDLLYNKGEKHGQ